MDALVDFGKFAGQPWAALLADSSYVEFCKSRPGLRQKIEAAERRAASSSSTTVVINNVRDEPTPQHNRLQNRFLDESFRIAVVNDLCKEQQLDFHCAFPGVVMNRAEMTGVTLKSAVLLADAWPSQARDMLVRLTAAGMHDKWKTTFTLEAATWTRCSTVLGKTSQLPVEALRVLNELTALEWGRGRQLHEVSLASGDGAPTVTVMERRHYKFVKERVEAKCSSWQFELADGTDVQLEVTPAHTRWMGAEVTEDDAEDWWKCSWSPTCLDVRIEIKPSLGDDYPRVLRTVKGRQESYLRHYAQHRSSSRVL